MDLKNEIIKHLKNYPSNISEISREFPGKDILSPIRSLLINNKLLLIKGLYSIAPKQSKMRNKIVHHDDLKFDSIKEGNRYLELKMLLKAGIINDLKLQVSFIVVDPVIWHGKKLPAIKYKADFTYIDKGDILTAEDVKGRVLPVYRIKRQLFILRYPEYRFIET